MIDVHPPHEATHTWTDFFIHIATIVVGILIAIGLEQTVELLHEHHQREELRHGVESDAHTYLSDVDRQRLADTQQIEDLSARIRQVREAASEHHPLPPASYRPLPNISTIRLANISAAKASGLIHLLSRDEINSTTDAEIGVAKADLLKQHAQDATTHRVAFEQRFQPDFPNGPFDFSRITPAQLDEYLGLLLEERLRVTQTLAYLDQMHRGSQAYINGQHNLDDLRKAERDSSTP